MAKEYDNTNRGALWARGDGIAADTEKKPPLLSGVLDVGGVPHNFSIWAFESEDEDVNINLKKALIALTKAAGGKLSLEDPTGGRPIFKASVTPRNGGKGGGSKPAPKKAPAKYDF